MMSHLTYFVINISEERAVKGMLHVLAHLPICLREASSVLVLHDSDLQPDLNSCHMNKKGSCVEAREA